MVISGPSKRLYRGRRPGHDGYIGAVHNDKVTKGKSNELVFDRRCFLLIGKTSFLSLAEGHEYDASIENRNKYRL